MLRLNYNWLILFPILSAYVSACAHVLLQLILNQVLNGRLSISLMIVKSSLFFLLIFFRKLLSENKHVKYLYIPYTDAVVVVKCNPVSKWRGPPKFKPKYSRDEALKDVRNLYEECLKKYRYNCYLLLFNCIIKQCILTC